MLPRAPDGASGSRLSAALRFAMDRRLTREHPYPAATLSARLLEGFDAECLACRPKRLGITDRLSGREEALTGGHALDFTRPQRPSARTASRNAVTVSLLPRERAAVAMIGGSLFWASDARLSMRSSERLVLSAIAVKSTPDLRVSGAEVSGAGAWSAGASASAGAFRVGTARGTSSGTGATLFAGSAALRFVAARRTLSTI
jgi:hypothetical protein